MTPGVKKLIRTTDVSVSSTKAPVVSNGSVLNRISKDDDVHQDGSKSKSVDTKLSDTKPVVVVKKDVPEEDVPKPNVKAPNDAKVQQSKSSVVITPEYGYEHHVQRALSGKNPYPMRNGLIQVSNDEIRDAERIRGSIDQSAYTSQHHHLTSSTSSSTTSSLNLSEHNNKSQCNIS